MSSLHVCLEMLTLCEPMSTYLTLVGLFTSVSPHMHLQVGWSFTLIITNIALVWSFTGMNTHVFSQMTSLSTPIPADLTYEYKFLWVCHHVFCQVTLVAETYFRHSVHLKGCSFVCVLRCVVKWARCAKLLPHCSHVKGLSPLCTCKCFLRLPPLWNVFPQTSQRCFIASISCIDPILCVTTGR